MSADVHERCAAIVADFEATALSPEIALMELLIASEDVDIVAQVLRAAPGERAWRLRSVFEQNREGCARLADILRNEQPQHAQPSTVLEGIAAARALFDGLVQQSEETSVALYSLGSPEILAQATREIEGLLDRWEVLDKTTRVLDFGCGIGRMERALASRVASVIGIDVSPAMVATATRRCRELDNVSIQLCTGHDLSTFADGAFDLVLAVDSFPYVVHAGMELASVLFGEIARVLTHDGLFVLLNFSYRGDLTRDGADVSQLAAEHRLDLEVAGEQPFSLWNGTAYRMRRR